MAYIVIVAENERDMYDDYGNRITFKYLSKESALKQIEQCVFNQHFAVMAFEENDSEEGE